MLALTEKAISIASPKGYGNQEERERCILLLNPAFLLVPRAAPLQSAQ